jgi:hypothetical protein
MPPVMIKAKSYKEFRDGAVKHFGDEALGWTKAGEVSATVVDFKDGKLKTVSFSMKPPTMEWAEADFGNGPIHDYDLDAIRKCIVLEKAHEKKHKEAIDRTFKMWRPKAEKALRDGTYPDKAAALKAIEAKMAELDVALNDACLELHKEEGLIEVTFPAHSKTANVVMKRAPVDSAGRPIGCDAK